MPLGHLDRLELSCDRPIPSRVREALRALDREEATRRPRTAARTKTNVVRLTEKGQVECMAEAMLRIHRRKGRAEERDLLRCGFTKDQIRLYGDRAVARATEIQANRERSA